MEKEGEDKNLLNDSELNDADADKDLLEGDDEGKEPVIEEPEEDRSEDIELGEETDTQEIDGTEADFKTNQEQLEKQFSFDREDRSVDDARKGIAEKFRERIELEEEKEEYEAIQPQLKINYWWTVILVIVITICLGVIVYLLVTRGTSKDMVNTNEQILAFNEKKSRYDQSLVDAVNKMIEAGAAYNEAEYADANDLAKEAERGFSTTLDYLYDLQTVDLGGDNYSFLNNYYRYLEDVALAGENMGDALAFSARSADRGQGGEAKSSLLDYEGFLAEFSDAASQIESVVSDHQDLFVE